MSGIVTASLLPSPAPRKRDEDRLHRSAVEFMRWALPDDAVFYHVPNGGLRSRKVAQRLSGLGVVAGVPDLAVVHKGHAIFIELKAGRGTLSAAQRTMVRKLIYCGADVICARTLPDVEAALRDAGVPLRGSVAA